MLESLKLWDYWMLIFCSSSSLALSFSRNIIWVSNLWMMSFYSSSWLSFFRRFLMELAISSFLCVGYSIMVRRYIYLSVILFHSRDLREISLVSLVCYGRWYQRYWTCADVLQWLCPYPPPFRCTSSSIHCWIGWLLLFLIGIDFWRFLTLPNFRLFQSSFLI